MKAAQKMQAPVLLQLTRSSIDYMGLEQAVKMGRQAIADYGVQGWIHLRRISRARKEMPRRWFRLGDDRRKREAVRRECRDHLSGS